MAVDAYGFEGVEEDNNYNVDRENFPDDWGWVEINAWMKDCINNHEAEGREESTGIAMCKATAEESDDLSLPDREGDGE